MDAGKLRSGDLERTIGLGSLSLIRDTKWIVIVASKLLWKLWIRFAHSARLVKERFENAYSTFESIPKKALAARLVISPS